MELVYGETKTYIIRSDSISDTPRKRHYCMYIPTSSSPGTYICRNNPSNINTASSLEVKPYIVWVKYSYHLDNPDEYRVDSTASLSISECTSSGDVISGTTTVKQISQGATITEYIAVNPNRSLLFDFYTGEWTEMHIISGRDHEIISFIERAFTGYVEISYQFDEAAPSQPSGSSIPAVKPGNRNILLKDGKIYTNNDDVTLAWERVADNKTNFEGHAVGMDWASQYLINLNGIDTGWFSDTQLRLVTANSNGEGSYQIKLKARDYDNNESSYSQPITLIIDRSVTQPSIPVDPIQVQNKVSGGQSKYDISFKWNAVTDGAGVKYQVALSQSSLYPSDYEIVSDITTNQYTFSNRDYSANTYYAYVRAVDGLGNTSSWVKSAGFVLASQPASITSIQSLSELRNGQPYYEMTLTLENVDAATYVIQRQLEGASGRVTLAEKTKAQLAGDGFRYIDHSNLVKHGKYTYFVYTKNSIGVQSGERSKTAAVSNIPATVSVVDASGQPLPAQLIINHGNYSFNITPQQDGEGDQLKFRVKYQTSDGSQVFYSSESNSLQTGPVTVNLPEGTWRCQLEAGEVVNGAELTDAGYSRKTTPMVTIVVDVTPPPLAGNSLVLKSVDGGRTYDAQNNPANTRNVLVSSITVNDNPGGSGVKGIFLWNGNSATRPADAVYKARNDISASTPWTLPDGDGVKTVSMQVLDNAGNTTLITYRVQLDTTPPGAPDQNGFQHTTAPDTINFQWRANNGGGDLTGFRGQSILPDGTAKDFAIVAATANGTATGSLAVTVSGYGPNLPVTLKVRSLDKAGNQSAESNYTAYTQAALGTLQNLSGGYDSNLRQHYLKWQLILSQGAQSYILEYGPKTGQGFTVTGSIRPDAGSVFTHSGLSPHGTYRYRLVALNSSGDRTEGPVFERQVPNAPPTAPEALAPVAFAQGAVEFKYRPATDDDGDALVYRIYLAAGNGTFTELSGNTAQGLIDGQTYSWYVIANDGGDNGKVSSPIAQFTIDNNPPGLTVEKPRIPYTNQKQLTITASDDRSGISKVTYKKIAAGTNEVLAEGTIDLSNAGAGNQTGIIQLNEGSYHLHFTAWDQAGNSTALEVNNLTVDQTPPQLSNIKLDLIQDNGKYLTGNGKLPVEFEAGDGFSGNGNLRYWIVERQGGSLGSGQTVPLSLNLRQYAQMLDLAGITGKEYWLALAVEDLAGNRSAIAYLGPIVLDLTPPQVTLNVSGLKTYGAGYYLADLSALNPECNAVDPEAGIKGERFAILDLNSGEPVSGWGTWESVKQGRLTAGARYKLAVRAINRVDLETETGSSEFVFDNTAPQNLNVNGPAAKALVPGEQVVFTLSATEPDSVITEYRLAIVADAPGNPKLTAQISGNVDGWLVMLSNSTPVQFRFELPQGLNGSYYPLVRVTNGAGLETDFRGASFTLDNEQERLTVSDQGPYTQFSDRLTGWWKYIGGKTVTGYQYRVLDSENQTVQDWLATTDTTVTLSSLTLQTGKTYRFEARVYFADGGSLVGSSPGITVDATKPQITGLITPGYATAKTLNFQWQAIDPESGIDKVWAALGSDYYQTDLSGGWIEVSGGAAQLTRKVNGDPLGLESGKRYYLTLRAGNGAGLATEQAASGIMIDNTAPPGPVIVDQGAYINPGKQPLEASWIWTPVDPESGPVSYQWTVIPYGADPASAVWNEVGQQTSVSIGSSGQFVDGTTYYFVVKATNQAGLTSTGYSNGITMDHTAPIIPKVTLLQAINLGDTQEAVYITNTNDLELYIYSYDLAGIQRYQYTYGKQTEVDQNEQFDTSTEPRFAVNPVLAENEITVFKSECSDGAQNISQAGYSSGVILDAGAPKIVNVRAGVSGNNILSDWDVLSSGSPVAFYEYALVPEAEMNSTPSQWTNVKLNHSLVLDGTNLADGNYRIIIRGCNAAGTYSRRQGEFNEWGLSPRITLDRKPPVLDKEKFIYPNYAAAQLAVSVTAHDDLSGIGGYQYALGTKANPLQFSNGWVEVSGDTGFIQFNVPTGQVPQNSEVYLMVRVKDWVGLWSEALVSQKIIIDHTLPVTPEVSCGGYITVKNLISGISFQSMDPESGLTNYRMGVMTEPGLDWIAVKEASIDAMDGQLTDLRLEEGKTYFIGVQTRNGAGEWSAIGYSQPIIVDTIPPELSFIKGDGTIVLNQPPLAIEYTLTEPAGIQFTIVNAAGSTRQLTAEGQSGINFFLFEEGIPQIYQLTAVPADPAGNIGMGKMQSIRVNAPPQISLPAELHTTPGAGISFTADVIDPDGQPANYRWDPGDGGAALSGMNPTYHYSKVGQYTLTLTVTDNDGGMSTATTTVRVGNTTRGSLFIDETWSGTHHLDGDITVPVGVTLTILPGTVVIANDAASTEALALNIKGSLIIQGATEGVIFRSANGADRWLGILVEGTATLDRIIVQDALRGLTTVHGATVTVTNCTFQNNQVGLHAYDATPEVRNSSFINNSLYGIKEDEGGRPVVVGCRFSGNSINYYHEVLTEISIEELNQLDGNSGNR